MKIFTLLILFLTAMGMVSGQSNILVTNPVADQILKGNYNPADFAAATIIDDPRAIILGINENVSPQLLRSYIEGLTAFETRNSGSDTLSDVRGIGAARTWVHQFFEGISLDNASRLQTFYLQFDQDICGMGRHKNICAVLPGSDVTDHEVIIVEAHFDSRCETNCDIDCIAHGAEDNASGTALIMELARVMAPYSFRNSIVFMCTTAEEQGLLGANAMAEYCRISGINVKAVFNNDVVGGIYCGATSSPPSCPEEGHIDSTQLRMFAQSGISRQLARFNRLEYDEELKAIVDVPMQLTVMGQEDRTGRGGDHIPFRMKGYAAMRFTSANENGSANTGDPNYEDHQHTSQDILGIDTDGDGILDSMFVDFNYLARNTVINGMAAALAALGPKMPDFNGDEQGNVLSITIEDDLDYMHYRVFSRSTEEYFDTIYTLTGSKTLEIGRINNPNTLQKVSVAAVDSNGIESLFSREQAYFPLLTGTEDIIIDGHLAGEIVRIEQNKPNPFDQATYIALYVNKPHLLHSLRIGVYDTSGKEIHSSILPIQSGEQNVILDTSDWLQGVYIYRLIINGMTAGVYKCIKI